MFSLIWFLIFMKVIILKLYQWFLSLSYDQNGSHGAWFYLYWPLISIKIIIIKLHRGCFWPRMVSLAQSLPIFTSADLWHLEMLSSWSLGPVLTKFTDHNAWSKVYHISPLMNFFYQGWLLLSLACINGSSIKKNMVFTGHCVRVRTVSKKTFEIAYV